MPASDQAPERLRKLRAEGEEFLKDAHARLREAQEKLLAAAQEAPARIRKELEDLNGRLAKAKEDSEGRAAAFRQKYLDGVPSEDEFRAHLVILEMEYASRMRIAEEGLRLLTEHLEQRLSGVSRRVGELCEEAVQLLGQRVYPIHAEILDYLRGKDTLDAEWRKRFEENEVRARSLAEEVARLRKELDKGGELLEKTAKSQRDLVSKAGGERRRLERELEKEKAGRKQAERGLEEARKELEAEREKRSELEALKRKLEEAQRTLGKHVQDLAAQARHFKQRYEDLGEPLKRREAEVQEERRLREKADEELERQRKALEEQQVLRERGSEEREELQGELREAREKAKKLEQGQAALKSQLQDAEGSAQRFAQALEQEKHLRRQEAAEREAAEGSKELEERLGAEEERRVKAEAEVQRLAGELKEERAQRAKESFERAWLKNGTAEEQRSKEERLVQSQLEEARRETLALREKLEYLQKSAAPSRPASDPEDARKLRELLRQLKSKSDELQRAKDRAAKLEEDLDESRGALAERDRAKKAAAQAERRLQEAEEDAEKLGQEVRDLKKKLAAEKARADEGEPSGWKEEREFLLEKLSLLQAEISRLRITSEQSEQSWQEALVRQDKTRLDEIFKLRSEVQRLKARLGLKND